MKRIFIRNFLIMIVYWLGEYISLDYEKEFIYLTAFIIGSITTFISLMIEDILSEYKNRR